MKGKLLFAGLVLITGLGAGQTTTDSTEIDPGLVEPGDPIYVVEERFDPFPMNPGERVHEKASEMVVADEKNMTEAREKAREQLNKANNKVLDNPSNQSLMGVEKAQRVLEQRMEQVPDEALSGIEVALNGVKNVKEKVKGQIPDNPGENQDGGMDQRPDERGNLPN